MQAATTRSVEPRRRGAAVVEFAMCAPLLFLLFFAAWEFSRANMIRHTMENAAYEGCRRGIVPGATVADVEAAARDILGTGSIVSSVVDVEPAPLTISAQEVSVAIAVPLDQNFWITPLFMAGKTLHCACTLTRERHEP
jgi:Flp pilus assembly protein TadG